MANRQRRSSSSPVAGIIGLGLMLLMIWLAFTLVKGVFSILSFFAIPLFIIAMILNFRVLPDYVSWVAGKIKKDPLTGIVIAGGSLVGYPLVAAWLAFKAYTTRKLGKGKKSKKEQVGDYVKFEEVEEDEDFLELEDIDKVTQRRPQARPQTKENDYDDLFE